MFEKRLFSLVPQATPYIMASVLFKWIALMANITVMWVLARILGGIVTDGLSAALLLACVPVIPVSIMMVMRNAKKIGAEYWGSYVDLGGMFLEAVQGLTTLKVYQADRSWHERINAESERFRTATMRLLVMQLRSICVMDLVVYMGAALGIIVAALQLARHGQDRF